MLKRWLLWITIIGIFYFSNTPNLFVSDPATWINKAKYEENVTLSFLLNLESVFYQPWLDVFHKEFMLHKIGHIIFYSILTMLIYVNISKEKERIVRTWCWTTAFAFTDEVHQYFVVGRSGRFIDFLFDSGISITCLLCIWALKRWRNRKEWSETMSLESFYKKM